MSGINNPFFTGGQNIGLGDSIKGGLASLSGGALKGLVDLLPKELGNTMAAGLAKSNLGQIFGDAFENIFLASKYQALIDTVKQAGETVAKSWEKADQAAFNYGKRLGMTSHQVKAFRDDIIKLSDAGTNFGIRYGKSLDDVIKLQSDFSAELGRNIKLTNSQLKDIAALSAVVGDDMAVKFSAHLENFGMSTTQAGELMTQMFNKSVKQGISLETYSKNVTNNLHIAQQYTFKRGVDGLMAMAEQASKMKLDMEQTISLANKLADGGIEAAVNMSADLQVLGGPFAQFADPMALLHGSIMDMEDLSNQLTGLMGNMGRFNKETGQIDIGAFDRQRLRSAASSMGLDYGKLIESATQQAKRKEVEAQMSGLNNIPEEYKELIMNTAQFQNGIAGVRGADGNFKNLSSLNGQDLKKLADFAKTDSENIRDIATMLRGMTDVREGMEKEKENQRAAMYQSQAEAIKGIYNDVGESKYALQQLVKIELSNVIGQTMLKPIQGVTKRGIDLVIKALAKKEHGGIVKTHSEGDLITNGVPGKEYILNSAQHGEFIVNKQATSHHLGLLRAINADKNGNLRIKQHEEGGLMGDSLKMSSFNTTQLLMLNNLSSMLPSQEAIEALNGLRRDRTIEKLTKSATEMKSTATKTSQMLNNWGTNSNISYRQQLDMADKYKTLVQDETRQWRKYQQMSNKELQTRYANMKIAKTNKFAKVGATGAFSVLAGVGSGIGAWQGYKADETVVMNKGKAVGGTVGSAIGATAGAVLGSFAGPVGMMIGSMVGEYAGKALGEFIGEGSKSRRSAKQLELAKELSNGHASNAFMDIKGDFSVSELKEIKRGMTDGALREQDLSKDLVEKMKRSGNTEIFKKTFERGGLLSGKRHSDGGIILNEAEGGEYIINRNSTAKSMGLLNRINSGNINDSNIKPVEPMGKQMKVKESYSANNPSNQTIKMEPVNININGTIKLDTGDKTFDISKELFNNPTLINKLTDIITKQINIDENGTFSRKEYRRRYSSI